MNLNAALVLAMTACSEPVPNDLELGNVHFKLENPAAFTPEEKKALFGNMKAAHQKLSTALGAEVMTLAKKTEIVVKKGKIADARGKTEYGNTTVTIGQDLRPHLETPGLGTTTLTLGELSEPNVAHEFIHIYAQNAFLWSEAFWEGTAYGLTHHLYPTYYPSIEDFQGDVAGNTCVVKQIFNKGWDTDQMDVALKGGIKAPELNRLVHAHWTLIWDAYADQHPDFFARFFQELDKSTSKGKHEFSREELLAAARVADPSFDQWLEKEGRSVREMERQAKTFAVETGYDQVSVFNFQARARKDKGNTFDTPLMGRMYEAETLLVAPQQTIRLPNTAFVEVNAGGLSALSSYQITLGGQTLPLIRDASCIPVEVESPSR